MTRATSRYGRQLRLLQTSLFKNEPRCVTPAVADEYFVQLNQCAAIKRLFTTKDLTKQRASKDTKIVRTT